MLFVVPNSAGSPEPDAALVAPLMEKWSEEARLASAAVRRARSKYQTKDDKKRKRSNQVGTKIDQRPDDGAQVADKVKARVGREKDARKVADEAGASRYAAKKKGEAEDAKAKAAADKKAKGGGGKGDGAAKVEGETKNAKGERVIKYSDGSTVTVHKDGKTATHTKSDGSAATGKYKDPTPAGEKRPKGFTADTPESTAREKKAADKKAETERKKAERERSRKPPKQKVLRVKLSRTKKGPRAGESY